MHILITFSIIRPGNDIHPELEATINVQAVNNFLILFKKNHVNIVLQFYFVI